MDTDDVRQWEQAREQLQRQLQGVLSLAAIKEILTYPVSTFTALHDYHKTRSGEGR